ncbi:MAG: FAD-dependent protein [bacterium]
MAKRAGGKRKDYDVIIVGAGPAGIFAALELVREKGLRTLLLEKGADIDGRDRTDPSSILSGWGGSGAFSDGKLNLSPHVGGSLAGFVDVPLLEEIIRYVDGVYVGYGAAKSLYGGDSDRVAEIQRRASLANLKLVVSSIRHIGTENCPRILRRIRRDLEGKLDMRFHSPVREILCGSGGVRGVALDDARYSAPFVIVAPGREGSRWLSEEAGRLGLPTTHNPVDIGVRVEVPAAVTAHLTASLYESKFLFASRSFDDSVRTFCMCPHGEVVIEKNGDVVTVNGHSYSRTRTSNTNFAVLVSTSFTKPFSEPIAYGRFIARLANLIGGGVIVQRLGDLHAGRRSTPARIEKSTVVPTLKSATPGDLSFVLPYRYLTGILEMLRALDDTAPGINSPHTLLYGVEVKFYSSRLELSSELETDIAGLYAVGDGAGVTRGLVQASASGVMAARSIIRRLKGKKKG